MPFATPWSSVGRMLLSESLRPCSRRFGGALVDAQVLEPALDRVGRAFSWS